MRWFPLFLLIVAGSVQAASLTITNHSFETDIVGSGSFRSDITPAGWSTYDPFGILSADYSDVGVLNPTLPLFNGAPDESNVALIFLWPQSSLNENRPVGLQQLLSATLQPLTEYSLMVEVGNIGDAGPGAPYELAGFPGYQVQLLSGPNLGSLTLLAQDNDTLAPADGQFLTSTVNFTTGTSHAQMGEFLAIRLINLGVPNSGIEVNYDNVRLNTVPEPSTAALVLGALLVAGFGMARKWRRASRE